MACKGCLLFFFLFLFYDLTEDILLKTIKQFCHYKKQPLDEKTEQKQDVKKNWFCIVVQINGKTKYMDIEK